jgi:hypothetical protein
MASRAPLLLLLLLSLSSICLSQTTPEQVHLSYVTTGTMTVTWVSQNITVDPVFVYSANANLSGALSRSATTKQFQGAGGARAGCFGAR